MTTFPDPSSTPVSRRVVANFDDYAEAERAVDYLSDNKFPVQRTTIVGRGLDLVEQITGRRTYLSAAGRGAASGAVVGALFGWLFTAFGWLEPAIASLLLALYGAVFGAVVGAVLGALLGVLGHAGTGGQRDFSSQPTFRAHSYEVHVDNEVADEAQRLLSSDSAPGIGMSSRH
ncbi:general stress protein [Actinophytocola glycyrrhizae]|uniref:General stress protein n=1 Tax=Actinophytocola glycyrrhizae TaxID=2044873 RepID=A0ABV9RWZ2_9PSEU